jgi:hypothetical protein
MHYKFGRSVALLDKSFVGTGGASQVSGQHFAACIGSLTQSCVAGAAKRARTASNNKGDDNAIALLHAFDYLARQQVASIVPVGY